MPKSITTGDAMTLPGEKRGVSIYFMASITHTTKFASRQKLLYRQNFISFPHQQSTCEKFQTLLQSSGLLIEVKALILLRLRR